eukprot:5052253-Prymnesium_polylepis.1
MMHTPLCSPTDQGRCADLSRWGTVPSCVSGSIKKWMLFCGKGREEGLEGVQGPRSRARRESAKSEGAQ